MVDWCYLAASVILAWWTVKLQTGQTGDGMLVIAHNVRKVCRKMDAWLTVRIDAELDERRTV